MVTFTLSYMPTNIRSYYKYIHHSTVCGVRCTEWAFNIDLFCFSLPLFGYCWKRVKHTGVVDLYSSHIRNANVKCALNKPGVESTLSNEREGANCNMYVPNNENACMLLARSSFFIIFYVNVIFGIRANIERFCIDRCWIYAMTSLPLRHGKIP